MDRSGNLGVIPANTALRTLPREARPSRRGAPLKRHVIFVRCSVGSDGWYSVRCGPSFGETESVLKAHGRRPLMDQAGRWLRATGVRSNLGESGWRRRGSVAIETRFVKVKGSKAAPGCTRRCSGAWQ